MASPPIHEGTSGEGEVKVTDPVLFGLLARPATTESSLTTFRTWL